MKSSHLQLMAKLSDKLIYTTFEHAGIDTLHWRDNQSIEPCGGLADEVRTTEYREIIAEICRSLNKTTRERYTALLYLSCPYLSVASETFGYWFETECTVEQRMDAIESVVKG